MIPRSFEYHDPATLDEVFALLDEYGEDGKLMAGGQSLLPMMKFRLVSPAHIIDLWRINGADTIGEVDGEIRIGALATHRSLEDSSLLRRCCPILAKAAGSIGDPQVRNMGTIGGSVAHADPAANYAPVLVALGAKLVVRSRDGERMISASEFYKDMFVTALGSTEMLMEICVPVLGPEVGWEHVKLSRRASDFALIGVAVLLHGDGNRVCTSADVVLGSVAVTPTRMEAVQDALRGKPLTAAVAAEAARVTALGPNTASDVHADAAYRKEVAPICVRRGLEAAIIRMMPGRQ
jgi:aerobic carbon-monoxide dehydrogenase medium subunit